MSEQDTIKQIPLIFLSSLIYEIKVILLHTANECNIPMAWRRAFVVLTPKLSATNLKLEILIKHQEISELG